jgi:2-polyprenyl-3-methyl-5-hydroxy-6-metoxy-1,4-benzoquinol methylase
LGADPIDPPAATLVPTFQCRLCGGSDLSLHYTLGNDGRFRYYKCANCRLVNLDLAAGLDQTQFNQEFHDPTVDSSGWDKMIDATFAFLVRHVPDARSLCDVGCGNGRLLLLGRDAGWRVLGLELESHVAARTASKLGVDVIAGNFLDYEPPREHAESYDVVCLRHVLEHLPDSRLAMRRLSELLRPGGHAVLEFPNIDGLDKRLKRFLVNAGLHHRRFREDFVAGHCNEFCRNSFEYLLDKTGFRLIRWETYSKKPLTNWVYNRVHVGNKARALVQKTG